MPILSYLADTNTLSDYRTSPEVRAWFKAHPGEVGISTITLAEIRRGIESKAEGKQRNALERDYRFILQDYQGAVFVFDEAAACEWGRLWVEAKNQPLPYDDSLIGAVARSCNMIVATRNWKHFPGCETVNPWDDVFRPRWQPT